MKKAAICYINQASTHTFVLSSLSATLAAVAAAAAAASAALDVEVVRVSLEEVCFNSCFSSPLSAASLEAAGESVSLGLSSDSSRVSYGGGSAAAVNEGLMWIN